MPQGVLKNSDEEFFTAPLQRRDDVEDPLLAAGKDVLAVDAPKQVAIDKRAGLPLVAIRAASFSTMIAAPFDEYAIAVACDLDTGDFRAGPAVPPPVKSVVPEPPRAATPGAMAGEARIIDLRERLELPWRPSHLAVSLILRESLSDLLDVRLDLAPGAYRDAEVEKHRRDERAAQPLPPIAPAPGKTLPAYRQVDGAPAVPDAPGVVLSGPRLHLLRSDEPLVLKGSFRLPVLPHLLVQPGARAEPLRAQLKEGELPSALVPVGLVVTGSEVPAPFVARLVLPAFGKLDGKAPVATGRFAINLDDVGNLRSAARTLFVYAFSGVFRFGPLPIALVEEG